LHGAFIELLMRLKRRSDDSGAAAVEFALILPVLVLMILGMLEFSRAYNVQISLSNAAREGARVMAIYNSTGTARTAAVAAAPGLNPAVTSGEVSISHGTCTSGQKVTVTINHSLPLMTGFFGLTLPMSGKGVMLCGG
jgi:Flp pilus assembly protein TadG